MDRRKGRRRGGERIREEKKYSSITIMLASSAGRWSDETSPSLFKVSGDTCRTSRLGRCFTPPLILLEQSPRQLCNKKSLLFFRQSTGYGSSDRLLAEFRNRNRMESLRSVFTHLIKIHGTTAGSGKNQSGLSRLSSPAPPGTRFEDSTDS